MQSRLGRAYRVPGRVSAAAALLAMLVTLGTGMLLTALTLPLLGGSGLDRLVDSGWSYRWRWSTIWPPVLNRCSPGCYGWPAGSRCPDRCRRGAWRAASAGRCRPGWRTASTCGWWYATPARPARRCRWCRSAPSPVRGGLGFLLAVAPAGIGPREVALPLLLGRTVAAPVALVAAVVSRMLMTVVDLLVHWWRCWWSGWVRQACRRRGRRSHAGRRCRDGSTPDACRGVPVVAAGAARCRATPAEHTERVY